MSLAALSCKPQNYKTTDSAFRNDAVAQLCISALCKVGVGGYGQTSDKDSFVFFRVNDVITLLYINFNSCVSQMLEFCCVSLQPVRDWS